jgi:hypothetical protein
MNLRRLTLLAILAGLSPFSQLSAAQPEPWQYWLQHDPSSSVQVSHSIWQRLLSRYVTTNEDGINRVSYADFDDTGKAELSHYLRMLSQIRPTNLNREEQLAYWINLYNAQTIQIVLDHPKKKSIRSMGPLFAFGPWDEPYLTIEDKPVTLNDIEHRILRPIWRDHRLHFVLNCASIGCPNLSLVAYAPDTIEDQLTQAETAFLQHPRAVTINDKDSLVLSSLFDWYQTDFAENEAQLLSYLAGHRADLAELLAGNRQSDSIDIDYVYDWDLNKAKN